VEEGDSSPLNQLLTCGVIPLHMYYLSALLKVTLYMLPLPLTAEDDCRTRSSLSGRAGVCRFTQTSR